MLKSDSVYIVIAAYNESSRIGGVLNLLCSKYRNIVVVDDGSSDNTAEIARQYSCHVLQHCMNRGQGASLQTGITYALRRGADIIVTFDADGQHDMNEIPRLIAPIADGSMDVVFGSRFLGEVRNIPMFRRWVLYGGLIFTRWTSGLKLTDCHNGFRALSKNAVEKIRLRQDRMAHASEFYDWVHRLQLPYQEVPVTITYNQDVLSKGQSSWNSLRVLFEYLIQRLY